MHDRMEEALREHLGQVTAPAELWNRVQEQRPHRAATVREWLRMTYRKSAPTAQFRRAKRTNPPAIS